MSRFALSPSTPLPAEDFRRRHLGLLALLAVHVVALPLFDVGHEQNRWLQAERLMTTFGGFKGNVDFKQFLYPMPSGA